MSVEDLSDVAAGLPPILDVLWLVWLTVLRRRNTWGVDVVHLRGNRVVAEHRKLHRVEAEDLADRYGRDIAGGVLPGGS